MKKFLFAAVLFVNSMAFADVQEVVRYTCNPFEIDGQKLIGSLSPRIVELGTGVQSRTFYAVKTQALSPTAKPRYEVLKKVSSGIENSEFTGKSYDVSFFFAAGARAQIRVKGSKAVASCVAAFINLDRRK